MSFSSLYPRFSRPKPFMAAASTLALALILAACASPTPTERVFFIEPQDGATVSSPVHVEMGAENFVIEPAGEVREGYGHLHIMVDTDCVAVGETILKDDTHVHYGQGQTEADLELAAGSHTLCLQAADGLHVALPGAGLTHEITITVE